MAIATLLVDLGGVLFHFDHQHRLAVLSRTFAVTPDQVDELLWGSGFSADCDSGRYRTAAEVRLQIRQITDFAGSDDDLDRAWCSAYLPDQDVVDLLNEVAGSLPCGVFTSNGPLEEEALPRLYPDAFTPFEYRFFGYRLSANKPDPRAFQQVGALLGVEPELIGFVDDSVDNVAAARGCGWQAVRFSAPSDVRDLLRAQ
jgi:FMN phosphatase YigB (HAD superfamily)